MNQIKEVVSGIRVARWIISDGEIVGIVLITLLPSFPIKIFSIQEIRAILGNDITLDGLVGHLTTFELSNYDKSVPKIENSFKSSLTTRIKKKEKNGKDDSD